MIFFVKHRLFFRLVSLITLVGMVPSSVEAGYFLPAPQERIWEIDLDSLLKMDEIAATPPAAMPFVELADAELGEKRSLAETSSPDSGVVDEPAPGALRSAETIVAGLALVPTDCNSGGERVQVAKVEDAGAAQKAIVNGSAFDALESIRLAFDEGRYKDAALGYLALDNELPNSPEAQIASTYADRIMGLYVNGSIGNDVLDSIEAGLPYWDDLTDSGKKTVIEYFRWRTDYAMDINDTAVAKKALHEFEQGAKHLLEGHPDSPLAHFAALKLFEVAITQNIVQALEYGRQAKYGDQDSDGHVDYLGVLADYLKPLSEATEPRMSRFASFDILAKIEARQNPGAPERTVLRYKLLQDAKLSHIQTLLKDPSVPFYYTGRIVHAIVVASNELGYHDAALEWLDYGEGLSKTRQESALEMLAFERARTAQMKNRYEIGAGSEELWAFVSAFPEGLYAPVALNQLATIYMTAGDYTGAASIYQKIAGTYQGTEHEKLALRELENLSDRMAVEGADPSGAEDGAALAKNTAMWCGPYALNKLLAQSNVEASPEELAQLAGTDGEGTTMQGLRDAAAAKGVSLTGVRAGTVDELPLPAIAFVDNNHFLLVSEAGPGDIAILDSGQPLKHISRFDFARRWSGEALILTPKETLAQVLDSLALAEKKGGLCGPFIDPNPQGDPGGPGDGGGGGGGGDSESCPGGLPGDPGSPPSYINVHTPGVNLTVQSFRMAPMLEETDLTIPASSGNVPLSFERYYTQDAGDHRSWSSTSSKPWQNTVGASWSHNYNMYIHNAFPVGADDEGAIVFYDATGSARLYTYDSTAGTKRYYYREAGLLGVAPQRNELSVTVEEDTTTGKFTMFFPSQRTLYFTAPSATEKRCRLESIEDNSGNVMTLAFDNADVELGRLTKVTEPSARYSLNFFYSGAVKQFTKAEMQDGGTPLQSYTYAYMTHTHFSIGAVNELTKVTDNNGQTVEYGYKTTSYSNNLCVHTHGRVLTKITDKLGCETTIDQTWPAVYTDDGEPDHIKTLDITNDEGLMVRYEGSSSGVVTITDRKWDGGAGAFTSFRKIVNTPVTGDTSRGRYVDYYYDASNYNRWETQWDGNGMITKELQPGGVVEKSMTYTALGRISTQTSGSAGPTSTYRYDASGMFVTKVTRGDGTETTILYDAYYRATKQTHPSTPNGQITEYDIDGRVTKTTNPLGHYTTYAYDAQGRQTASTNALSQTTYTYYDQYGKATKLTDANGKHSYSYYDNSPCSSCGGSQGQLTKTTDALGNDTFFYYDANSRMTKVKNALNQETDFVYDCLGRRLTSTFPSGSGNHMITQYDLLGLATKSIDLAGNQTLNYYDERGRLTKATYPVVGDVDYFYDLTGLKTKVTDALDHSTEYFFDYTKHQLTKTLDALGKELRYYYDSAGRVTKTGAGSSGDIMPTLNYYNATTGQMTKTRHTDAASNTADVQYFFNGAAQMTKLTDWTGDLEYRYSNIGQLTKIIDYDTEDLVYAYDAVGRVTSMTDYHGASTSYEYDDGGRLTTLIAPGSKEWEFVYNDLGQPIETYNPYGSAAKSAKSKFFQCNLPDGQGGKLNPDGTVETFGYDSRNRLTRRYLGTEATGGTDLEEFLYELDAVGNITKTTELDGTAWTYAYDNRYRLTSAASAEGTKAKWKETYVYDNGDNLLTKTTPIQHNFDNLSTTGWSGAAFFSAANGYMENNDTVNTYSSGICMTTIPGPDYQGWFSYQRDGSSPRDGSVSLREVTGTNRLSLVVSATKLKLIEGSMGNTPIDDYTVTLTGGKWYEFYVKLDGANVEVWMREKGTTDAMIKVLETTSTTITTSSYVTFNSPPVENHLDDLVMLDLSGNTLETETQAYNAANEMTSQTADGGTTSFTYDQFGRMTQKTRSSYTGTYYYNYGDKLTKVASNFLGEGTVTYTYSGDQKRRSRSVSGGAMTKYRVDQGWGVVNEENSGGTLLSTYVHHPGRQIGTVLATSEGSTASSGTWNYYFQDAIGSTRGLWDEDGHRLGKYDYTPFGGKYGNTGEEITRKFTGHDWDSDARLYHTAYRQYSPDTGRWLTRDPLGMVDGPNVYAYVVNNPVSAWDALGLETLGGVMSSMAIGGMISGLSEGYAKGWTNRGCWSWQEALHGFLTGFTKGAISGLIGVYSPSMLVSAASSAFTSAVVTYLDSILFYDRSQKRLYTDLMVSALSGAFMGVGAQGVAEGKGLHAAFGYMMRVDVELAKEDMNILFDIYF